MAEPQQQPETTIVETLIRLDTKADVDNHPPYAELAVNLVTPAKPIPLEITKLPSRPRKIRKVDTFVTKSAQLVPRSLSSDADIDSAIQHLHESDPLMAGLIELHPRPKFDEFSSPFQALAKSIIHQQLTFRAGDSVYSRFLELCGGGNGVVPETVINLDPQDLRQIGVSGRKASYLHDLARKFRNGILSDDVILSLDDKSLFRMLSMVNGIGSWSIHMFMIFSLHREDVLPVNDLGVRKGVQHLLGLEELPRPSQMEKLCEKWRPYRSVAAWYLWRYVEAGGISGKTPICSAIANLQHQHQQQQVQQEHLSAPSYPYVNVSDPEPQSKISQHFYRRS